MAQFPKRGLKFEYVRDRIKKYDSINRFGDTKIKDSMINQVRICEGEKAADELNKEFPNGTMWGHPIGKSLSGNGHKQIGWGKGKKLGDGKWVRNDKGKWKQVLD